VQLLFTSERCHPRIACGLTRNDSQRFTLNNTSEARDQVHGRTKCEGHEELRDALKQTVEERHATGVKGVIRLSVTDRAQNDLTSTYSKLGNDPVVVTQG
jgi:hypothetical protein